MACDNSEALTEQDITDVSANVKAVNEWAEGGPTESAEMANGRVVPSPSKVIFDARLYKPPLAWPGAGTVTDATQAYIGTDDVIYAANPALLPLSVTGVFATDIAVSGAWYVIAHRSNVRNFNNIAELPTNALDGDEVSIAGFYSIVPNIIPDGGGGSFVWDAGGDALNHDGGITIDPNHSGVPGDATWWTPEVGTGVWRRKLDGGPVSPACFGAKGNDVGYDSLAAIDAAFATISHVHVPPDTTYYVSDTLRIPIWCRLTGSGETSSIDGLSITGAVLEFGQPLVLSYNCVVEHLNIGGIATTGVAISYAIDCTLNDITMKGSTFDDGFTFYYTWGSTYKALTTDGAGVSDSCYIFLEEVNANVFSQLYTSTICENNFLFDGTGHGNVFNAPTAQGGRYGFYIKNMGGFGGLIINNLYTENTVRPLVMGIRGNPTVGGGAAVTVQGATLAGPSVTHPYYSECVAAIELNSCTGVDIRGVSFIGTALTAGGYPTVVVTGDGTGAQAIARVTPTGEIHSIEMITFGTGYTTASAVISGGGGSGATLGTPVISSGGVASIAVTAGGTGYKRTQTPMAIIYDQARQVTISACDAKLAKSGAGIPLYPLVVRDSAGVSPYTASISIDDVSALTGVHAGSALIRKAGGGANDKFAIVEYDSSGAQVINLYSPPSYP